MQASAHTLALNAVHRHVNLARVRTTANTQECESVGFVVIPHHGLLYPLMTQKDAHRLLMEDAL